MVSLDDAEDNYEAISIAGAHPRTNDLLVDGASFNDDFGLTIMAILDKLVQSL